MNDSYQDYVNRVVGITRAEHYQQQLQRIHSSPKYKSTSSGWQTVEFPGRTIVAPPKGEDPVNQKFYDGLILAQQKLQPHLPDDFLLPLPTDSLHITLADLLWADAYEQAASKPDFAETLHREISNVFQSASPQKYAPLKFQALGYMVMPRALGICLVPDTETTFERLIALRRSLYQQESLLGLGIEQHYHLTLHITLGYFGNVPEQLDIAHLTEQLSTLNQTAIVQLPEFVIQRAELRAFEDMSAYHRQPGWPVLEF